MLHKANLPWSVSTLKRSLEKENLTFDIGIQRNHVWDCARDSLLINSIIEGYIIPPLVFTKDGETKQYKGIDGQQRSLATTRFISDEYALHASTPDIEDDDGNTVTIAGLKFSELPEAFQAAIRDFNFIIYYYEDIDDDQIQELFDRLNNGVPLTVIEKMRAKTLSIKAFQEIAAHPAISESITAAGRSAFKHELVAMQMYSMVRMETPTFLTKSMRPFILAENVSLEHKREIQDALDFVSYMFGRLKEDKANKNILRKIKTPTNLVSLFYMSYKAQQRSGDAWISQDDFMEKAVAFFTTPDKATTVNPDYNDAARTGSAKPERVRTRMKAIEEALDYITINDDQIGGE